MIQNVMKIDNKEYILCAAIKRLKPRVPALGGTIYHPGMNDILNIELGYRHCDIFQRFYGEMSRNPDDQGFYTSKGRFVNRTEAMRLAYNAGQLKENVNPFTKVVDLENMWNPLYSEDLY